MYLPFKAEILIVVWSRHFMLYFVLSGFLLTILFTQSMGYLEIKVCSSYKNNGTHLQRTYLIRKIYL